MASLRQATTSIYIFKKKSTYWIGELDALSFSKHPHKLQKVYDIPKVAALTI